MKTLADFQRAVDQRRVIYLDGHVNDDMVTSLRKQIADLGPGELEIAVVVRTGGGWTGAGFAIFNEIHALASIRPVSLIAQSYVNSFGLYLMLALPLEKRLAFPMATFFGHWGRFTRNVELRGSPSEVRYLLQEIQADIATFEREQEMLLSLLVDGTTMSREDVEQLFDHPQNLTTDEALERGIISGVLK